MALSDSAYVAIGIASVVGLLLLIVLFLYCLKHQHDKEDNRRRQEEMQRRERHRRQLMRTQIVRPPPYDPNRGTQAVPAYSHQTLPMSPPPEYKERATPLPQHVVGIGGVAQPPPSYTEPISTVSRNVAPTNTAYTIDRTDYINNAYYQPAGPYYNDSNNNNNNNINAYNAQIASRDPGRAAGSVIMVQSGERANSRVGGGQQQHLRVENPANQLQTIRNAYGVNQSQDRQAVIRSQPPADRDLQPSRMATRTSGYQQFQTQTVTTHPRMVDDLSLI